MRKERVGANAKRNIELKSALTALILSSWIRIHITKCALDLLFIAIGPKMCKLGIEYIDR